MSETTDEVAISHCKKHLRWHIENVRSVSYVVDNFISSFE